ERRLPHWYVHTWDVDRDAARSYRLDRMRKAKVLRKTFAPREGFDPAELRESTKARVWYSPDVARWEVEKGAVPLVDGAALAERGGHLELAAVRLGDRARDVEAEAATRLRGRAADTAELLEHEALVGRGDAAAAVGDVDDDAAVHGRGAHLDELALRRVLD